MRQRAQAVDGRDKVWVVLVLLVDRGVGERERGAVILRGDRDLDAGEVEGVERKFLRDGKRVDVVTATTKIGNTLLLDRLTGKPIFPYRERRAPTSTLPGEMTWPYQPDVELPEPTLLRRAMWTMRRRELHLATTNIACREGGFFDDVL